MLLERAREAGADVRERHRVDAVDFDADGVTLAVSSGDGARRTVRARALVDATGRHGLLAKKFDLRARRAAARQRRDLRSLLGRAAAAGRPRATDIRLIARNDAGWFWLIPIDDRLMSVGVVLPRALLPAARERLARADAGGAASPTRRSSPR